MVIYYVESFPCDKVFLAIKFHSRIHSFITLIATKTLMENVHYLSLILNKFGELNVKINWTKSKFFKRYIKYLGRDIDGSGISFDEEKVSTMANIPNPRTASELMAFINSCSFMRSHRTQMKLSQNLIPHIT